MAKLDFWTAWLATPEVYAELAKASVVAAVMLASFLVWNQERSDGQYEVLKTAPEEQELWRNAILNEQERQLIADEIERRVSALLDRNRNELIENLEYLSSKNSALELRNIIIVLFAFGTAIESLANCVPGFS